MRGGRAWRSAARGSRPRKAPSLEARSGTMSCCLLAPTYLLARQWTTSTLSREAACSHRLPECLQAASLTAHGCSRWRARPSRAGRSGRSGRRRRRSRGVERPRRGGGQRGGAVQTRWRRLQTRRLSGAMAAARSPCPPVGLLRWTYRPGTARRYAAGAPPGPEPEPERDP